MSQEVESDAGKVQFLQYHRPGLTPGDYVINVEQVVTINDRNVGTFNKNQKFTVAGERFELKPTDVEAVFPPDGNLGDHYNVFPHIILNCSTLPWERAAEAESAQPTGVPWLALLLFDADEKPKVRNMTLADLNVAGAERFDPQPLVLEKGQQEKDIVTVIDVPAKRLREMMPTTEELKLLAHVRCGIDAKGNDGDEVAVIISNRLPQPGKTSFAYLVSLEKRLQDGKVKGVDNDDAVIRLVSLQSWSFACESAKKDFNQLLLNLNKTSGPPATLRLPRSESAAAEKLLSRGYVLLPHYFRHGDQTASWFHGPLTPGQYTNPKMGLPARTADELVRYDPDLSMFDVSYAAAWELGRLLALQDKAFSTALYQWKRELAQGAAQLRQRLRPLPYQKMTTPPQLPDPVASWFDSLRKLEGVPFNYLVPDERMLPVESIRFFRVDQAWMDCLADGALSIGRVSSSDHAADKLLGNESPAASLGEASMGFLLRSEVVSGWPGLQVEAYAEKDHDPLKKPRPKPLDVVRIDRLDDGVLLCIFRGEIGRVEIYQKPEALHFGLKVKDSGFFKELRDPKSGKPRKGVEVKLVPGHWRSVSNRIANISGLAKLVTENQATNVTSSAFALQMVEGAEKVIFRSF